MSGQSAVSMSWEQLINLVREGKIKKEYAFDKMSTWRTRLEESLDSVILPVKYSLFLSAREFSLDNLAKK